MTPNTPALLWRETRQREIVQVNKAIKEPPGGIDLHGQPCFGKIDLNLMRPLLQATTYLCLMLAQQIFNELLVRIIRDAFGWVHQT